MSNMDYKPGEHPLADILDYGTQTYGDEPDIYIRSIRDIIGSRNTFAWWEKEIGRNGDSALALRKSREKLDELDDHERRAKAVPAIYKMDNYRAGGKENNFPTT